MAEKPSGSPPPRWLGVPFSAYEDENVLDMLRTDLSTYKRHPYFEVSPRWRPPYRIDAFPQSIDNDGKLCRHIPDVADAIEFGRQSTVNKLLPQNERENKPKDEESAWKFGEYSREYEDLGVKRQQQRGIREYIASGYTRRNPDGKTDHDKDWAGKWKENPEFQVVEHTWWQMKEKKEGGDTFGDPATDWVSGEYKYGARQGDAKGGFSVTKQGVDAKISGNVTASAAEGKADFLKDQLLSATAEGAVFKGKLEGEAAFVANPEEITLGLKLAGRANVVEGSLKGEVCLTPTRGGNAAIKAWNWAFDEQNTLLTDDWDIGICFGGELQGAVGAQAEAGAEAGYKDGKARAEAGVKLGLGVGGGAKLSGGLTGLDKAADLIKGWMGN